MKNMVADEDFISLEEFRDFLFDKVVPIEKVKDLSGESIGVTLPYWRKNELIPFIPKGIKFDISFAQLFWLRILDILRSFSYTVKNTKKVCDYFYKDAYNSDLPKKNLANYLSFLKKQDPLTEKQLNDIELLQNMIYDENLMYVLKFDINYLTNLINFSLINQQPAGVYIFNNGDVLEHLGMDYFNHNDLQLDIRNPHIYISVDKILEEFIRNDDLENVLLPQILSDDEAMVIKELRKDNIDELLIKKDGTIITQINTKSTKTLTGSLAANVKVNLGMGNYEEVTLITRDEKTLIFKKNKKNRLR